MKRSNAKYCTRVCQNAAKSAAWRKKNLEKVKVSARKWLKRNRKQVTEAHVRWAEKNPERIKAYKITQRKKERKWRKGRRTGRTCEGCGASIPMKKRFGTKFCTRKCQSVSNPTYMKMWRTKNSECVKTAKAKWHKENPERDAASRGLALARKRTPNCVPSDFNFEATIPFYAEAHRITRDEWKGRHEVDHIVPLCFGGKHEAANLQVISKDKHAVKNAIEHAIWIQEHQTGFSKTG